LDELADTYDQEVPDPDAATRLTSLATSDRSLVGYLGKLIPQKGVHLLLAAHHASRPSSDCMVVGFGSHREWLSALAIALREPAGGPLGWLQEIGGMPLGPLPARSRGARDTSDPVIFTGRLDHRYAPGALAAMDVLVIPSILEEAFGMVAAEGAAAGALPLVAAHSGLAEVASVLEQEVGRPGLFSFRPGPGGVGRIASGIGRLLELPPAERRELRRHLSSFVAAEWSWERTCTLLLSAAAVD
jgi:glycosyltransferase involved in cell wall biosynthesis